MFITKLWDDPIHFIFWTVMVVFSVCVHELSHVYAALSQGDDTAARQGYITLDPLKLMGIPSLIALAFIGIAWGAVPVTPSRFRRRYSHALVAASGPLANLVLAVLCAIGTVLAYSRSGTQEAAGLFTMFFLLGLQVNCMLALLNLLPIPMFDGWEVAALLVPALERIPAETRQQGSWIALMLLFLTPLSSYLWKTAFGLAGLLLRTTALALPAAG